MHAQIGTVREPEMRVQIVSERSTFDENPAEFHKRYAEKQVGAVHTGDEICFAFNMLSAVMLP
jgi:Mg-chelatase subunit ChlI